MVWRCPSAVGVYKIQPVFTKYLVFSKALEKSVLSNEVVSKVI